MAFDAGITNLADIKNYLRITAVTENTFLTTLGKSASNDVEELCERIFCETTHTEEKHDADTDEIILKHYPITDPDSVVVKVGTTTLDSSNYQIYADEGIIKFDYVLSADPQDVKITYPAGYTDANMPLSLQKLVWQLVAADYMEVDKGRHGMDSESAGAMGSSTSFSERKLTPKQQGIIDRFTNRGWSD